MKGRRWEWRKTEWRVDDGSAEKENMLRREGETFLEVQRFFHAQIFSLHTSFWKYMYILKKKSDSSLSQAVKEPWCVTAGGQACWRKRPIFPSDGETCWKHLTAPWSPGKLRLEENEACSFWESKQQRHKLKEGAEGGQQAGEGRARYEPQLHEDQHVLLTLSLFMPPVHSSSAFGENGQDCLGSRQKAAAQYES